MGRSALDFISSTAPSITKTKLLLIGSKPSHLLINNEDFEVVDPLVGLAAIRENSIFFNAAFLRREFLQEMSPEEYLHKNEEIVAVAKRAINEKKLLSFVNLSSGVARDLDADSRLDTVDEYSKLKKRLEIEYSDYCNQTGTALVNCRIFSLTGRHLNEFENLALSSFIRQAKIKNKIEVKSPLTKRTYVDATDLAGILLAKAALGKDASFDSGGSLVSMRELAEIVISVLKKEQCEIITGDDESPDYFGDYKKFYNLALEMDLPLADIKDQVTRTLAAFN